MAERVHYMNFLSMTEIRNILWWCLNIHKYALFHPSIKLYATVVSITF